MAFIRRRYTFSKNGIITRNICLIPDVLADVPANSKELVNTTDPFEIQQAIDPSSSGDLEDANIRGRFRINELLAEIRYGTTASNRYVQVNPLISIMRHGNVTISIIPAGIIFRGTSYFYDPVNFQQDITIQGNSPVFRRTASLDEDIYYEPGHGWSGCLAPTNLSIEMPGDGILIIEGQIQVRACAGRYYGWCINGGQVGSTVGGPAVGAAKWITIPKYVGEQTAGTKNIRAWIGAAATGGYIEGIRIDVMAIC